MAVRALILELLDVAPIADGATLFTCQVAVGPRTRPGTYPMRVGHAEASSPAGWPLSFGPFGVCEGSVTVPRAATRGAANTSPGCQVDAVEVYRETSHHAPAKATPVMAVMMSMRSGGRPI